ncbi:TonB-dependent receptor [candidate division KSB1 bacterium]|nr:TonB-dependent receptor [candidate division KSB1 bacterium]
MKFILPILCLVLAHITFVPELHAGITGKIAGKVVDEGGNALPGANVIVVGTQRGAATTADGSFVILSLAPGRYTVSASMIGYNKMTHSNVVVNSDRTTDLNFTLTEAAVEGEEVVVTAERPLVEKDRTYSEYHVESHEIERLVGVASVGEVLSLQPGMDIYGQGSIRGGDMNYLAADVVFYVDGVRAVSTDGLNFHNFLGIQKYSVESISILTGGLSAEYGNAQGGIVNIVTKEGSDKLKFWIEYGLTPPGKKHWGVNYYDSPLHRGHMHWDDPQWVNEVDSLTGSKVHERIDYTDKWGQYLQVNVSGPLVLPGLSFFLSSEWNRSASSGIGAEFYSDKPYTIPQSSLKLTYNVTPSIKFRLGGVYNSYESWNGGPSQGGIKGLGDSGRNIFLPMYAASAGKTSSTDFTGYLSLTHLITPKLYYDLHVSYTGAEQKGLDVPDSTTETRLDEDGWFHIGRTAVTYSETERNRISAKFDLSYQAPYNHFIKTGVDFTQFETWATSFYEFPDYRSVLYLGKNHQIGKALNPRQWAFYIQDKMEFEGLVVNAGVRMDRFEPEYEYPATIALAASNYMYNTFTRLDYEDLRQRNLLRKAEPQTVWAPRFGVAHPITERASLHFFYGHIYQLPSFYTLYGERWINRDGTKDLDLNKDGQIGVYEIYNNLNEADFFGNPNLGYEKTINFELGADWNFYKDYIISATTYYKSASNQVTSPGEVHVHWWDPASAMFEFEFTQQATNGVHEDIQGFEISLRKRFSNHFAFELAYNLQWATEGQAGLGSEFFVPDSEFVMAGNFWTTYKADSTGREVPQSTFAFLQIRNAVSANNFLDSLRALGMDMQQLEDTHIWSVEFYGSSPEEPKPGKDIRSIGKAQVYVSTPGKFGPLGILGDINLNLIYRLSTGAPFLYSPLGEKAEWRHAPLYYRFDLTFDKTFGNFHGIKPTFFLDIRNLFNQKLVTTTSSDYIRWGLHQPRPDNEEFLKYGDYTQHSYAGSPRYVRMGLRLSL